MHRHNKIKNNKMLKLDESEQVRRLQKQIIAYLKKRDNLDCTSVEFHLSKLINDIIESNLSELNFSRLLSTLYEKSRSIDREYIYKHSLSVLTEYNKEKQKAVKIMIISETQMNKVRKLLGLDLNENSSLIEASIRAAVDAGSKDDFEKLNSELSDIMLYLGAGKLDENDQKDLLERLALVIKQLVPQNQKIQKMKVSDFQWSPRIMIKEESTEKIDINSYNRNLFKRG